MDRVKTKDILCRSRDRQRDACGVGFIANLKGYTES